MCLLKGVSAVGGVCYWDIYYRKVYYRGVYYRTGYKRGVC